MTDRENSGGGGNPMTASNHMPTSASSLQWRSSGIESPSSETSSFEVVRHGSQSSTASSRRPPPPITPVSNFSIEVPEIPSGSSEENVGGAEGGECDDDDLDSLEDILPRDSAIISSVREMARRRAEESISLGSESMRILDRGVSETGDHDDPAFADRIIGDNGTIYSDVIRRRRQLLEGRADDGPKDVVMCVFWASRKIAASYYDLETGRLFMLPDIVDSAPDFAIVKLLFHQVHPSYLIANKSTEDRFLEVLHELTGHPFVSRSGRQTTQQSNQNAFENNEQELEDEEEFAPPPSNSDSVRLYLLRPRDFALGECEARVQALKLPYEPKKLGTKEHLNFISSLIPFSNNENLLRAMGCLLKFLDKSAIEIFQIDLVDGKVPVVDVELIQMNDIVLVEDTAWQSLQIFNTEFHPSSLKTGNSSSSKEGLSVYSLLNQCVTMQGAKKMRLMLLQPSRNKEVLLRRYDTIDYCMNPNNFDFVKSMTDCLKSVKSIPKLLYRISVLHATVNEWRDLYQTLYNCMLLSGVCSSLATAPAFILQVGSRDFSNILHCLSKEIVRIVDFEQSAAAGRIVAQKGLDPELDKKKKQLECLPEIMSIIASEEMSDLPPYVPQCCAVYIPEIGYLLAVSLWKEDLTEEECEIENLEFRFKTNELVYYKSSRMREMDVIFGDCSVFALEMETKLMVGLTELILEHSSILYKINDIVSELDCLISMAVVARSNNLVRPVLAPGHGKIKIKDGRHPISDIIREFVPNSTIFKNSEQVAILTGPNASGKSVYLKQVGVIAIMALSGSFVPASYARIPLFDKIFTRIHAKESVSSGFSTFMIDLNQMALALRSCTKNSLVIIDEFGKGTAEVDGLSLLTASLQDFIDRKEDCPTIFLSTHFFALINLLKESPLVKLQTMKFVEDGVNITYLYQLEDGYCDQSFARIIAGATGADSKVIERAAELEKITKGEEPEESLVVLKTSRELADEELSIAIADEFLAMDLKTTDLEAYLEGLRKRVDDFLGFHA